MIKVVFYKKMPVFAALFCGVFLFMHGAAFAQTVSGQKSAQIPAEDSSEIIADNLVNELSSSGGNPALPAGSEESAAQQELADEAVQGSVTENLFADQARDEAIGAEQLPASLYTEPLYAQTAPEEPFYDVPFYDAPPVIRP